ncbi:hypothetical protein L210DRAFT_938163, partial [Boletus edulis BED1]
MGRATTDFMSGKADNDIEDRGRSIVMSGGSSWLVRTSRMGWLPVIESRLGVILF